jgi:hypothetical protein
MKVKELFEEKESKEKYLYHVTYTNKVSSIKRKGILPLQTSNWVKGDQSRYGEGEIFAFENMTDSVRWAAKMDWEFSHNIGTGKISVIRIKNSGGWIIDNNDPVSQAGRKGDWVKKWGKVSPTEIDKFIPITLEITKKLAGREDIGDIFGG